MEANRTEASGAARFRIVAAEAHSWSSLLLEDERGQRYLYVVGTQALTEIAADAAEDLIAKRAYRTWRGERSWTALDQLPLLGQVTGTPAIAGIPVPFSGSHQDDVQTS
ncbi:MAG: hypothetical protein QOF33_1921 [Thermomicrobiales bacterium]|jgi:hypothetical protein|nr:hypothetical protein [Thermomicrobiales bacterium]